MNQTIWTLFAEDIAETIRSLIAKVDAILANATPDDIAGLATWGALTCSGIHIAVYRGALHFQAEINRSTPAASAERQHGWGHPPSKAPEMTQLRLYVKQQLAETGYGNVEVVTLW